MQHTGYRLPRVLAALVLLLALGPSDVRARGDPVARLLPGQRLSRILSPGTVHDFAVELQAGQAAIVSLDQRGVDVVLRVFAPDGREVHRVDRPNVEWGREAVTVVADAAGLYTLRVSALILESPQGHYQIQFQRLSKATPQVLRRVEAERAVSTAETARATNSIEGCRDAAATFLRARSLWRRVGEPYEEGVALYGLALAHRFLGEHEKSLDALEQALRLVPRVGERHLAVMAHAGLAWTYLYLDDYRSARTHFRIALAHRRTEDLRGRAGDLFGLGWADLLLGAPVEALVKFNDSLLWRTTALDRSGEALTLVGLAASLDRLGRWQEALDAVNRALRIQEAFPNGYGQADAFTIRGWALLHGGDALGALQAFTAAAALRRKLADLAGEAAALHGQAGALEHRGLLQQSLEVTEAALTLVESVRVQRTDHDLRAMYFASVQELYERAIRLLLEQYGATGEVELAHRAFYVSERARARSLLDLLASRNHRDAISIKAGGPAMEGSAPFAGEPSSIEAIQAALAEDTVLLTYSLGSPRSALWLVGRHHFNVYDLPSRTDIDRAVHDLLRTLTVPQSRASLHYGSATSTAGLRERQRRLTKLILPDAALSQLRKRIIVVPSGSLQLIPFSVLSPRSEQTSGVANLLEDHELIALPSASAALFIQRPSTRRRPTKTLALFADPVYEASDLRVSGTGTRPSGPRVSNAREKQHPSELRGLPRLFASRWEAEQISRLVPPSQRTVALDFRAARSTLEALGVSNYRFLHFGTHAVVNMDRLDRSGLVLSLVNERGEPVNGFVSAYDILKWPLAADLVVLSGCRTGVGREIRGEGLMAVSRAFLAAGASRLVISLWPVHDKITAELMVRFYQHMLGTQPVTPAAALRAAQLEISANPSRRHPYYWAGFVLQGRWD